MELLDQSWHDQIAIDLRCHEPREETGATGARCLSRRHRRAGAEGTCGAKLLQLGTALQVQKRCDQVALILRGDAT
jgi:hypothetical protein